MRSREELDTGLFDCPHAKGPVLPMRCMFCGWGHMLECHYPFTCEEAVCSHYLDAMEDDEYGEKYDTYYVPEPEVKAEKKEEEKEGKIK